MAESAAIRNMQIKTPPFTIMREINKNEMVDANAKSNGSSETAF